MLQALLEQLPMVASHHAWPRVQVNEATWCAIGTALRAGELELLGEWGDEERVHCALREAAGETALYRNGRRGRRSAALVGTNACAGAAS